MSASPERSPGLNPSGRHNASPAARRQGDLLALGGSSGQWPPSALPPAAAPAQNHDRQGQIAPRRLHMAPGMPASRATCPRPSAAAKCPAGPPARPTNPPPCRASYGLFLPPVRIPSPRPRAAHVASLIPGRRSATRARHPPPPTPLTRPAGTKTSRSPRACRPSPPSCTSPFRAPRAPTTATGSPTPSPAGSAPRRPARRRARPPRC